MATLNYLKQITDDPVGFSRLSQCSYLLFKVSAKFAGRHKNIIPGQKQDKSDSFVSTSEKERHNPKIASLWS